MRTISTVLVVVLGCSPAAETDGLIAPEDDWTAPRFEPHPGTSDPEPDHEPDGPPTVTTPDPDPEPQPDPEPDADPPPASSGGVPLNINVSTYINLGDSAGEGCCTDGGNQWSYFSMLEDNDPGKYPLWDGFDLPSTWPTIATRKNLADSGDTSADVKNDQLPKLAASYSAPVIITIHVGGNDFNDHKLMEFFTNPQKIAADGEQLEANIDAILTELESPARFPAGAYVFVANIFSPSDDQCGFSGKPEFDGKWCDALRTYGCLASGWVDHLTAYNQHIAAAVAKHDNAFLVDSHAAFLGHGMTSDEPWFNKDCVHPNAAGHHAIRAAIFEAVTGLAP